ncbi:MAG: TM1802 family CRISPR-associated protein [Candidatus Caldatribacteriaceae bacterium]
MMLEAIKELSDILREKGEKSSLEELVEDPNSNGKYNDVFVLALRKEGGKVLFSIVEWE